MAARISRAKQRIKAAGSSFSLPDGAEREERLRVVLHVLYLIYNEGYTASSGSELHHADLAREAIRLARMVHAQLPEDGEVTGLLDADAADRRPPGGTYDDGRRPGAAGRAGPCDVGLRADRRGHRAGGGRRSAAPALGPYQLQAAIAATHADAVTAEETNWLQVHALYLILERITPNPMVTLNRAIALAETEGPLAGLALLSTLDSDERMAGHHRLLLRARASAGKGRRLGRSVRALPARREGNRQHRRAALPGVAGQQA